jgi:hypothetical protein
VIPTSCETGGNFCLYKGNDDSSPVKEMHAMKREFVLIEKSDIIKER